MKRLSAETASAILAFMRLIVEALSIDDGQTRIILVIDPSEVGEETKRIVGLSRWHRQIGGKK